MSILLENHGYYARGGRIQIMEATRMMHPTKLRQPKREKMKLKEDHFLDEAMSVFRRGYISSTGWNAF